MAPQSPAGDAERLASYVALWWDAVRDLTALLEQVPDEQWSTPTDLPGWDVRALAAHTAHLEQVLATGVEEHAEVGEAAHVRGPMGRYMEIGVVARREHTPTALVAEIREAAAARHEALLADPPTDGDAPVGQTLGGAARTWSGLLANRVLDVWMHEQDVRRAVGIPGGLGSPAAAHSVEQLATGFGWVLGKQAQLPPGTAVSLVVEGHEPSLWRVDERGRGVRVEPDPGARVDVALRMDREAFVLLAGGRRDPSRVDVEVVGDQGLGEQVLARMALTP